MASQIFNPEKKILMCRALPIYGEELHSCLIEQLDETFQTEIRLTKQCWISLNLMMASHHDSKAQHQTKTIIIAMGGGAFKTESFELDAVSYSNLHHHVSKTSASTLAKVAVSKRRRFGCWLGISFWNWNPVWFISRTTPSFGNIVWKNSRLLALRLRHRLYLSRLVGEMARHHLEISQVGRERSFYPGSSLCQLRF